MAEAKLHHLIKEATRKRCKVFELDEKNRKQYEAVNPELFHFLYELESIDFPVFFRVETTMVEFIKPKEFSTDLLDSLWGAMQKNKRRVEINLLRKDRASFDNIIYTVRKNKIDRLISDDPGLDKKTLTVFSNLSSASQMIVRGGITQDVAEQVKASASYMVSNLMNSSRAMATLSRMVTHDPTLYDHSASVAMIAGVIATQCLPDPMSMNDSEIITRCGLYHDVGKTCVPSAVLNKPGKFTPDEFEVMKTHSALGAEELKKVIELGAPIEEIAVRVAVEHHERMNGQGYPDGKLGRAEEDPNGIHVFSRIIMIADVYSALLMKRVYKPSYEPQEAIKIMAKIGPKEYDMEIFPYFLKHVVDSVNNYEREKLDGGKGRLLYLDDSGQLKQH